MGKDMTVACGENGMINIRVGAIIQKKDKILMVRNIDDPRYLYSVGGRIKFGETAEEAVMREVLEETGVQLEIDRLGFVHENYFPGDTEGRFGNLVYEIAFIFYMKVPEDFEPVGVPYTESENREELVWITPDGPEKYFPKFFRTELMHPEQGVKHMVTDDRNKQKDR